jgi:hypothetical protein
MNGLEFSLQMLDHLGNSQIATTGERTNIDKNRKTPYSFNGANVLSASMTLMSITSWPDHL